MFQHDYIQVKRYNIKMESFHKPNITIDVKNYMRRK